MKSYALAQFISIATAGCSLDTFSSPRSDLTLRSAGGYGYDGLNEPLAWHKLSANNSLCATGKNQSPINLVPSKELTIDGSSLAFQLYSYPEGGELENLGNTVQVQVNGSIMLDNWVYNLVQFHFHTPSEHHLMGEHFPLEVHFVAQNDAGSLAIIAFFVEIAIGDDRISSFLTAVLSRVKEVPQSGQIFLTGALNHTDLQYHLSQSDVYQYNGSLTTPPCSEHVFFNVVASPLYLHPREYRALKKIMKYNSRYTQNRPGQDNLLSRRI
ncbi:eukaryotic-type carbonic anhydrase domain-containing protein [Hirsutella rhossiliensis]|uniref:Carbonic anhydrase n=1 Tax=Hirsutella rhossiliensis TaxID=111463 RepID=A0A9P8MMC7_9HYPO|nr:eukaryotic-type carbonic anhydrase domain-containing protein [Hirsutella rhossiliensis]KAH0958873.1 eukaryotic-type carbonic anhydrase domain-containing protein [Hirsutella rhossiliensis]